MNQPMTIFVSSTCYDLSQIRKDIKSAYNAIGVRVLLSDEIDFPVLPGEDRLEACYKNVLSSDVFVLVIGRRLGYVTVNGKSVTNNELNTALESGIPTYCFIDKSIIAIFDIYKANPSLTIPGIDNKKLIDFAISVYSNAGIWTYPFESFADIHNSLSRQLPVLLADALRIRKRLVRGHSEIEKLEISAKAMQIILDRPKLWEYLLFSQVLSDQLELYRNSRLDLEVGFGEGIVSYKYDDDAKEWFQGQLGSIKAIIAPIDILFGERFRESAFGPDGSPGDPRRIVYFSKSLGRIYKNAITWKSSVIGMVTHEEFDEAKRSLSRFADSIIVSFESFVSSLAMDLSAARVRLERGEKGILVNANWILNIEDGVVDSFNDEYRMAIERLRASD